MSGVTKKPVYQSASRVETFQTCSALYAAKYLAKLPDPVGDAARRGSVAHDTLELLLNPRHDRVYRSAILHDSALEVPALNRVISRFARYYDVFTPESLAMINDFIMTALKNDFRGVKGTYKAFPEQPFELQIDRGDGRKYAIKGFIDQAFFVRDQFGEWLDIKDFKTGAMFRQDKIDYPFQALMYLTASRHLWPQFKRRRFRFQFVKGKNRWIEFTATDGQLDGFEWILTELQVAMDAFTMDNALDRPKAADGGNCWLYGKECEMKRPRDYFALVDEKGGIVATANTAEELRVKQGQKIEAKHWNGCPYFYDPKTGARRNLN